MSRALFVYRCARGIYVPCGISSENLKAAAFADNVCCRTKPNYNTESYNYQRTSIHLLIQGVLYPASAAETLISGFLSVSLLYNPSNAALS